MRAVGVDRPFVGAAVGAWRPGGKRPLVLIGDGEFQMVGQAVDDGALPARRDRGDHRQQPVRVRAVSARARLYTNPAQAPLAYNVLPDWNFDAFAQSLGVTQVATANTVDALRTALAAAKHTPAGRR